MRTAGGTPNEYPSDNCWEHAYKDSSGIHAHGQNAFTESRRRDRDRASNATRDAAAKARDAINRMLK